MRLERLRSVVTVWICSVGGLLFVDLSLSLIGRYVPPVRQDPDVWGTYSAWAAAILPSLSILTSVWMWMKNREDVRREKEGEAQADRTSRMRDELANVTLGLLADRPRWLINKSGHKLVVVEINGNLLDKPITMPPGDSQSIEDHLTEYMEARLLFVVAGDDVKWSLIAGARPVEYLTSPQQYNTMVEMT